LIVYTLEIGVAYEGGALETIALSREEILKHHAYAQFEEREGGCVYRKVRKWDLDDGSCQVVEMDWGR